MTMPQQKPGILERLKANWLKNAVGLVYLGAPTYFMWQFLYSKQNHIDGDYGRLAVVANSAYHYLLHQGMVPEQALHTAKLATEIGFGTALALGGGVGGATMFGIYRFGIQPRAAKFNLGTVKEVVASTTFNNFTNPDLSPYQNSVEFLYGGVPYNEAKKSDSYPARNIFEDDSYAVKTTIPQFDYSNYHDARIGQRQKYFEKNTLERVKRYHDFGSPLQNVGPQAKFLPEPVINYATFGLKTAKVLLDPDSEHPDCRRYIAIEQKYATLPVAWRYLYYRLHYAQNPWVAVKMAYGSGASIITPVSGQKPDEMLVRYANGYSMIVEQGPARYSNPQSGFQIIYKKFEDQAARDFDRYGDPFYELMSILAANAEVENRYVTERDKPNRVTNAGSYGAFLGDVGKMLESELEKTKYTTSFEIHFTKRGERVYVSNVGPDTVLPPIKGSHPVLTLPSDEKHIKEFEDNGGNSLSYDRANRTLNNLLNLAYGNQMVNYRNMAMKKAEIDEPASIIEQALIDLRNQQIEFAHLKTPLDNCFPTDLADPVRISRNIWLTTYAARGQTKFVQDTEGKIKGIYIKLDQSDTLPFNIDACNLETVKASYNEANNTYFLPIAEDEQYLLKHLHKVKQSLPEPFAVDQNQQAAARLTTAYALVKECKNTYNKWGQGVLAGVTNSPGLDADSFDFLNYPEKATEENGLSKDVLDLEKQALWDIYQTWRELTPEQRQNLLEQSLGNLHASKKKKANHETPRDATQKERLSKIEQLVTKTENDAPRLIQQFEATKQLALQLMTTADLPNTALAVLGLDPESENYLRNVKRFNNQQIAEQVMGDMDARIATINNGVTIAKERVAAVKGEIARENEEFEQLGREGLYRVVMMADGMARFLNGDPNHLPEFSPIDHRFGAPLKPSNTRDQWGDYKFRGFVVDPVTNERGIPDSTMYHDLSLPKSGNPLPQLLRINTIPPRITLQQGVIISAGVQQYGATIS